MSSCSWRSGSTPGRVGPTDRTRRAKHSWMEHRQRDASRRDGRLVLRDRAGAAVSDRVGPLARADRRARTRVRSTRTSYVGAMQPGGWLAPHVHAYEEALYVLEGELLVQIGGRGPSARRSATTRSSRPASGMRSATRATARSAGCRSTRRSTLAPDAGRQDTFFEPAQDLARDGRGGRAAAVRRSDPAPRRALRRDAAAARGARDQGRRARTRTGRDGHRAASPTAASRCGCSSTGRSAPTT